MIFTILGVNRVPLSYVVRENDDPDPEGHNTFVQKCIACAPLTGPHFEADARRVHQLVTSFTQGEISEQWIKMHSRAQNGRVDLQALYAHYQGAGNTTRRIAEAGRLQETLHYKNEQSLSFSTFLAKVQHMFNLFEEEGEPMTEAAKLRFLLDKVNHSQLESDVSALRVKNNLAADKDKVTFTKAENILAASVSNMPEYQSKARMVSALGQHQGDESENGSIYRDGKIFTGYYKNWRELSKEDKDKVDAERVRMNTKKQPKNKQGGRKVSFAETKTALASQKKALKQAKRQITSLRRKAKSDDSDSDSSVDKPSDNAGNSFGGRSEKDCKKNKKRTKK